MTTWSTRAPDSTKKPTEPATSRALWSFQYVLSRSPKSTAARRVRKGTPAETSDQLPSILESAMSAPSNSPPIEPPPSAIVRHLHRVGHVVRDIDAAIRRCRRRVLLWGRRHFPRLPRVQENARAPLDSEIYIPVPP